MSANGGAKLAKNINTEIKRVITCGVRWGATANSYADLMTVNGVCVLGTGSGGLDLFRHIKNGDLIALKDGRNIIALGKPRLSNKGETSTTKDICWKYFFLNILGLKLSKDQLEKKANHFEFSLDDEIDVITIEEWIMLDTPIYYPLVQSTVTIRDEEVKQECINRFNELGTSTQEYAKRQVEYSLKNAQHLFSQYMVMSNDDIRKATLSNELLSSINIVLNYDPENEIAKTMKDSIIKAKDNIAKAKEIIAEKDKIIEKKSDKLFTTYKKKADSLTTSNKTYEELFIITLLSFILLSSFYIYYISTLTITKEDLIIFIATRGLVVSSIILSVFWIARFLNKRIHENVYLIEEYEYRALIFESLQNLKGVFEQDIPDDLFRDIMNKIIENPAINLLKIKDKKSDETRLNTDDIVKLLSKTITK